MTIDKTLLQSVEFLAERGFHGSTIARITGLSKAQVYYRTSALGKQLRNYRDGHTAYAKSILPMTPNVKEGVRAKSGEMYQVRAFVNVLQEK